MHKWTGLVVLAAAFMVAHCGGDPKPGGASGATSGQPCEASDECANGLTCVAKLCVSEDALCSDTQHAGVCETGSECVDGECVQSAAVCSDDNPMGRCPEGERCRAGDCHDSALFCGTEMPQGLCADPTQECVDGVCAEPSSKCTAGDPQGACAEPDQTCVDGSCVGNGVLCSPARPTGLCAQGLSCLDGTCVTDETLCSGDNPTGRCEEGSRCLDGTCLAEALHCSADNPAGLCSTGQRCDGGRCVASGRDAGAPDGGYSRDAGKPEAGTADGAPADGAPADRAALDASPSDGSGPDAAPDGESNSANDGGANAYDGSPSPNDAGPDATNAAPVADLSCPAQATVGVAESFDASGSADQDGSIVDYSFDFGDGQTASGASATRQHAYAGSGVFTASLTVTDDGGDTDTITCPVSVQPVPTDDPPVAAFSASPSGGTSVIVDASASSDAETPAGDLEVRWDFTTDGVWDTAFGTTRVESHDFGSAGTYTITLEVRDDAGQTTTTTRGVSIGGGTSFVSGTVNTTTWSGTVVVQGDVTVPAGETLTILPGTQVLAVYVAGTGGVGTVGIRIDGSIDVQGTAADPVVFSTFGAVQRNPNAWDGLFVTGEGATLHHTVIEYATDALHVGCVDTTVTDATFQLSNYGIHVTCNATSTFDRVLVRDNVVDGVFAQAGTVNLQNSTVERNGEIGVRTKGANSMALANTVVQDNGGDGAGVGVYGSPGYSDSFSAVFSRFLRNGGAGVHVDGYCSATVSQSDLIGNALGAHATRCPSLSIAFSDVRDNHHEGLQVQLNCGTAREDALGLTDSNVVGNGFEGSGIVVDPGLYVSSAGTKIAGPWATPAGEVIRQWYGRYYETAYGNGTGTVRSNDGTVVFSTSTGSSTSYWRDISEYGVNDLVAEVTGGADWYVTLSVGYVFYYQLGFASQISVIEGNNTINAQRNYWGTDTPTLFPRKTTIDTSDPRTSPVPGAGAP